MYGCAATFTGVWIIAWVPNPPEPSTGPNDLGGAINDTETDGHDPFVTDGIPAGVGMSPKSGSLGLRRGRLNLVGIAPAQVQFSIFRLQSQYADLFFSASYWFTHHLGRRFISDKNMEWFGKRSTLLVDGAEKVVMEALEGSVRYPGWPMGA